MKRKYILYDLYDMPEYLEVLGKFDTMEDVKKACRERDRDTDSECVLHLRKFDKKTNKYTNVTNWHY